MLNLVKMASNFKGSNHLLLIPPFFLWDSKFYPLFLSFSPIRLEKQIIKDNVKLSLDKCHVYKHVHALSQFMRDMNFYNLFAPKCWICLTYRRPNSLDKNQFYQKSCDFFYLYLFISILGCVCRFSLL